MTSALERLLPLWAQPVDARPDPVAAFGEVYADPVLVNGTELALADLVDRARALAWPQQSGWHEPRARRGARPALTCAVIAARTRPADGG